MSRRLLARRAVIGLVLALAVGGYVWVFTGETDPGGSDLPPAVEAVLPQSGSLELRQTAIVADLAPGFTGYLVLDGVELPADQVRVVEGLNRLEFVPGPDSDVDLRGAHCATVVYWRIGFSRDDPAGSHRWCFNLT